MSRIGKQPVDVPGGVKVGVADGKIRSKGPLGKLDGAFRPEVRVAYDERPKQVRSRRERTTGRPGPCTA